MGKEVKIGLSVIGTLLCALGGVVYKQVTRQPEESVAAAISPAPPALRSGPRYASGPTVAAPPDETSTDAPAARTSSSRWNPDPAAPADDSTDVASTDESTHTSSTSSASVSNPFHSRAADTSESAPADPTGDVTANSYDDAATEPGADSYDAQATTDSAEYAATPTPDDYLAADVDTAEPTADAPLTDASTPETERAEPMRQPASNRFAADKYTPHDGAATQSPSEEWSEPADASFREPNAFQPDPDVQLTSGPQSSRRSPARAADASGGYGSPTAPPSRTRASEPNYQTPQTGYGNQNGYGTQEGYGTPEPAADPTVIREEDPANSMVQDPGSEEYVVEPDENFWAIAKKLYGSGAYFKALYEYNRPQYPRSDQLRAGDIIAAPPLTILERKYPHLCPRPADPEKTRLGNTRSISSNRRMASVATGGGGRTYTVEEGDTLFDIARHELGKAGRWVDIYDLNREQLGQDFDYLQPGTVLMLPADDSDPRTTQPHAPLRR